MDVEDRPGGVRALRRHGGRRGVHAISSALAGLALLLACGSAGERPSSDASGVPSDSLAASLIVQVRSGEVGLVFQVTNATGSPIAAQFPSHQRFDFVVSRERQPVWTWSADKLFAQGTVSDTLPPWETWRFDAEWAPPEDVDGTYEARAWLLSSSLPVQAAAEFQLP